MSERSSWRSSLYSRSSRSLSASSLSAARSSCSKSGSDVTRSRVGGDADAPPEGGGVTARVRLAELVLVECLDAEEELELVAQMRPHHLRPVRRDRERHLVLDERPQRVAYRRLVGQRLRQEVRRGADLERDPEVADRRHEAGILRREDPVPDAIGAEVLDDVADLGAAR